MLTQLARQSSYSGLACNK